MQEAIHIVVIRFSAMGDVAMAVPIVRLVLKQHPHLHITFVSNQFLAPLFKNIHRCTFFPADTKGAHKGMAGLWKLHAQLKKLQKFEAVADLHNVLRSKILRSFFTLSAVRNSVIDKGRAEKKKLTARENKILHPLPSSHQRYADVFARLGFPVDLLAGEIAAKENIPAEMQAYIQPGKKLIGIAPFAQHAEKMYPLQKMKLFLQQLSGAANVQLLFFAAPGSEANL
ncbi:MAG: ADP-heptose--LPS heptosyltransferase RfaF, partial [Gloeobacteraceae cyanobacterium ES-bin-316]|nr:ADP-heptose--LPS heptosyltransferase RfaF [Ferruginibacter sp.]